MKVKDLIRNTKDEQLTEICLEMLCQMCTYKEFCDEPIYPYVNKKTCRGGIKQWLESEVEE